MRNSACPTKDDEIAVASHPLGIKPSGNAYTAEKDIKSAAGRLHFLPDEVVNRILEFLDASSLTRIGATCKFLYAFSRLEDLWKSFYIDCTSPFKNWRGTWRESYLNIPTEYVSAIDCSGLFSDVLYRPFLCARTPLCPYYSNIPSANQIARHCDLSALDFADHWSDKPFILTQPVKEWPVYRHWSKDSMLEQYGHLVLRAEAVDLSLKTYVTYMENNQDESPLYLFDRSFVEKMDLQVGKELGAYWSPSCFGEDLFSVLGNQRPDFRWLIIGPERSGSTFHKDPNATSAWNAILMGSKYWIMFPTHANAPAPPGVFVSEDQSEVTSPLSIAEWLLGFHAEARKTPGCKEGVCHAGEVLHVPSGWWHLVVNLEPSIAITQNFVPDIHLSKVLDFLKNQPQSVSGFGSDVKDAYGLLLRRMREQHPELLEQGMEGATRIHNERKRKWGQLVNNEKSKDTADAEEFSFGFGGEDDDIP